MSNEADSRDTTPFPRWGETVGQVPDANVVEPASGKKDIGWVPASDGLVGEWVNWLHWSVGVFLRYIENVRALMWTRNHVMAGAAAGEAEVSVPDPTVLEVDITEGRVWLDGAMYVVPAIVGLAPTAQDPTDPRIDLVVAKLVGGVPTWDTVTGTPDPSPEAPALPAGAVRVATLLVFDASVTLIRSLAVDRREFGAVDLDVIVARKKFSAGTSSAYSDDILRLDGDDHLTIGDPANPMVDVDTNGNDITIDCTSLTVDVTNFILPPETVQFPAPIVRKFDIDAAGIMDVGGAPSSMTVTTWDVPPSGVLVAAVRVPNGCTITDARIYGTKVGTAPGGTFSLKSKVKTTGAFAVIGTEPENIGDAGGAFVLEISGLSHFVDQTKTYFVEFSGGGTGNTSIFAAEVEYTEARPFNGL